MTGKFVSCCSLGLLGLVTLYGAVALQARETLTLGLD